jgi:hypothetical protein
MFGRMMVEPVVHLAPDVDLQTAASIFFESRPTSGHTAPPANGKGAVEALGEFVQFGDAPAW